MDSNAHSPMWGCTEENKRGEELGELFASKLLLVRNTGNVPTFKTSRAQSIIDVTVTNAYADRLLNFENWHVNTEEASFSDHRYINFELGRYQAKEATYRNLRKANWLQFQSLLDVDRLPEPDSRGGNLDKCAEGLERLVRDSLDLACPMRRALDRVPQPWWTLELQEMRDALKALKGRAENSEANRLTYLEARHEYRRTIKQEKRKSWQEFCSKAESAKEVSKIMQILKGSDMFPWRTIIHRGSG